MMHRANYRMPSCTNQFESTHGRMNSNTPLRNCMWPSDEGIIHSIMKKNQMFESHFKHNYLRYKTKNICANTPENKMEKIIHQYKTNLKTYSCNCSENTLLSSMIQESLPFAHLHYMAVEFPDIAAPNIMVCNSTRGELIVEYNYAKSEKVITDDDYYSRIRKYASKVIQKYTHHKKEDCFMLYFIYLILIYSCYFNFLNLFLIFNILIYDIAKCTFSEKIKTIEKCQ